MALTELQKIILECRQARRDYGLAGEVGIPLAGAVVDAQLFDLIERLAREVDSVLRTATARR